MIKSYWPKKLYLKTKQSAIYVMTAYPWKSDELGTDVQYKIAHTLHKISVPKSNFYQLIFMTWILFSFLFLWYMFVPFVLDLANAERLKVGFYAKTCPQAETIVKKVIVQTLSKSPTLAAPFLRMHFHDCFVRVRILNVYFPRLYL